MMKKILVTRVPRIPALLDHAYSTPNSTTYVFANKAPVEPTVRIRIVLLAMPAETETVAMIVIVVLITPGIAFARVTRGGWKTEAESVRFQTMRAQPVPVQQELVKLTTVSVTSACAFPVRAVHNVPKMSAQIQTIVVMETAVMAILVARIIPGTVSAHATLDISRIHKEGALFPWMHVPKIHVDPVHVN